ncbi:hypothetical protein LTR75_002697 [Friedmanniomyces endolithicus]|nr:hypothetical protein LTR75_002697 [Friedmanniomyces endolithicus]
MAPPSKRGLCWPTANHGQDEVHTFTKPGSKISWLYNWSPDPTPNASSLDYVPMQWNHMHIDDLPSKVKTANATAVLGFNEPELPDQSNMSAELAAREWLRCVEPLPTNWDKDNPLPKEHVEAFAKTSAEYLDTLEWVERYAWFGPMRDTGTVGKWARMLDDDGNLTDLGKTYRDA